MGPNRPIQTDRSPLTPAGPPATFIYMTLREYIEYLEDKEKTYNGIELEVVFGCSKDKRFYIKDLTVVSLEEKTIQILPDYVGTEE